MINEMNFYARIICILGLLFVIELNSARIEFPRIRSKNGNCKNDPDCPEYYFCNKYGRCKVTIPLIHCKKDADCKQKLCNDFGFCATQQENRLVLALDLFQSVDSDTNGKITLKEFNASKHHLDDIKGAFDKMDQDQNGVITIVEIDADMKEFLEYQNNTETEVDFKLADLGALCGDKCYRGHCKMRDWTTIKTLEECKMAHLKLKKKYPFFKHSKFVKASGKGVDLPFGCIWDNVPRGKEWHVYMNSDGNTTSRDPNLRPICKKEKTTELISSTTSCSDCPTQCPNWPNCTITVTLAPNETDIDDNLPWYTFGYGSLLSSSSRIISECGLRGQQEDYIEWSIKNLNVDVIFNQEKAECIRQKQAKQFIPAEIQGYRRGWYSKGKLPQKDMKENSLFIRPTFLGLVKDEKYNATGLLYSTTIQDLKRTDEREKGAGYMYETLSRNDLRLFSNANIPDDAKIRVYTSGPDQIDSPTKRFPIVQSYVDVFLGGAIEIEENNPKLQNFSLNTCKQTYGWSGGWLNDRPYPRHRAVFLSIRAEKIDNLLYQCMKDNELSEDEHKDTVQNASSLRPLHSTDFNDIKFPGECDRGCAAN